MVQANEQAIRQVVEEVLAQLGKQPASRARQRHQITQNHSNGSSSGQYGVFSDAESAIVAAKSGFEQLSQSPMAARKKIIEIVKQTCFEQAEELGRLEFEETKIGRLEHKIEKLKIIKDVPGTEWLRADCVSGDNGLTVTEYAPFGIIGAITPVTHSLPTLAGNIVNMVAAGNSLVCNPHPSGRKIAAEGVRRFNQQIEQQTGLQNVVTIVAEPTLETAEQIFNHRDVRVLCVTGGPGVARAALSSRKKAIVAGPGNPPVVVDETADLDRAATSIVAGAAYDNNLLCIGEKEVFAVNEIFDQLMSSVEQHGGYRLSQSQFDQLTSVAFQPTQDPKTGRTKFALNRDLIGRDASVLAQEIGLSIPKETQILFAECDESNPFVSEEQMMPCVPFVRTRDAAHAIELAKEYEHGFGHTAIIHSRNVDTMTYMGRVMNTTLFVKNGPSMAGLGLGGEGYLSFSIATPTGEGVTNPLTFTRQRRCVLSGSLNIV
ncbi:aldehyde dehydrogenase family protein [Thalassoroseus pseudoceratinae]|uniref:aldehyde dehydrogenase family protein n=1 Tax=Thalassoroseus pseudoceratinae TaxID=2713176 RepID=UPI00142244A6|nr:aldehyde dehydrogenase family protein [Thalassoroseus pseudoceratinae]